jgi:hypothetical protein
MTKLEMEQQLRKNYLSIAQYPTPSVVQESVDIFYSILSRVQAEIHVTPTLTYEIDKVPYSCVQRAYDSIPEVINDFNRFKKVYIYTISKYQSPLQHKVNIRYFGKDPIVYNIEEDLSTDRRIKLRKRNAQEQ